MTDTPRPPPLQPVPVVSLSYARAGPGLEWRTILRWTAVVSLGVALGRAMAAAAPPSGMLGWSVGSGRDVFYIVLKLLSIATCVMVGVGAARILRGDGRGVHWLVLAEWFTIGITVASFFVSPVTIITLQRPAATPVSYLTVVVGQVGGVIIRCGFSAMIILLGRAYRNSEGTSDVIRS